MLDRRQIFKACEDSLKRLQTDYIDLYQTHWPDHGMRHEETLSALTELVKQGKVRAVGCSNETSWGLMKNLWEAEKHGLVRMDTVQNNFSLINRRCESELAQVCRQEGVSLLPYSPLGGGVLTGKYNGGALPDGAGTQALRPFSLGTRLRGYDGMSSSCLSYVVKHQFALIHAGISMKVVGKYKLAKSVDARSS